jgi:ribonuclease-3
LNYPESVEAVQAILGHTFHDRSLLESALTHASVAEHRLASNERLEFLGDAVLGLVICEELYNRFPEYLEGEMTRVKSVVVSREACARVAQRLNLISHLAMGKGITDSPNVPASLAACALEAIIGALYLDGGLEPAKAFILKHMTEEIDCVEAGEHRLNYKSLLQQHAQHDLGATPSYDLLDEKGPDHAKAFEIAVVIRGRRYPGAWGPSKKAAEQLAAMEALRVLGQLEAETEPVGHFACAACDDAAAAVHGADAPSATDAPPADAPPPPSAAPAAPRRKKPSPPQSKKAEPSQSKKSAPRKKSRSGKKKDDAEA